MSTGANDQQAGPAAGWYPDPNMVGTQRYWDGSTWTEHVAPLEQTKTGANNDGLAVVGILTAILIPIVGFICGFVLISRDERRGIFIVVLSMAAFIVWYFLLTGQLGSDF